MSISDKIKNINKNASWIRKMFEEGARLKKEHGNDKVFDFTLGNPNIPPPEQFDEVLTDTVTVRGQDAHGYMPNAGLPAVRASVAGYLAKEHNVPVRARDITMTCGAAGALNVILKTLLDAGDEVITPTPFFVEYKFYADNHGGFLTTVPTNNDFTLDLPALEAAVSEKTKAVLINSPNNPTGQIYSEESLKALAAILARKSRQFHKTIYLVSDEPYRKIVYDGVTVPSILEVYPDSLVGTSYSKDLSLPGERIGFVVVNPAARYRNELNGGISLSNRILGFVNAPALMQRVVARLQGVSVDIFEYQRKRDLLCGGLSEIGYRFTVPPGAFYLFPESPIPDDVAFVAELQKELVLAVPGSGFGGPGYFRLAYCVDDAVIKNAMPGFKRAFNRITDG